VAGRECRAARAVRSTQSRAIRLTSSAKVSVEMTESVAVGAQCRIADSDSHDGVITAAHTTPIQKLPPKVTTAAPRRSRRSPEAELGKGQQASIAVDQIESRRATVKISAETPMPIM